MAPTQDDVRAALARVNDPEIRKPITELGMVRDVTIADDGHRLRSPVPRRPP